MTPFVLRDHRVLLSVPTLDDIPAVFAWCQDPEMARWTTIPQPYTVEDATDFVTRMVPEGWATGTALCWAVRDVKKGGSERPALGTVEIAPTVDPPGDPTAEIHFALAPEHRGQGWTTAALHLVLDWAVAADGLNAAQVRWRAGVGNWASRRVAWKLGFRIDDAVRSEYLVRGERCAAWLGLLNASDPREPNEPWVGPDSDSG